MKDENWLIIFCVCLILVFGFGVFVGYTNADEKTLYVGCNVEELPDQLYLVDNFTVLNGSYYSEIELFKPVKYVGGGVLVWVR